MTGFDIPRLKKVFSQMFFTNTIERNAFFAWLTGIGNSSSVEIRKVLFDNSMPHPVMFIGGDEFPVTKIESTFYITPTVPANNLPIHILDNNYYPIGQIINIKKGVNGNNTTGLMTLEADGGIDGQSVIAMTPDYKSFSIQKVRSVQPFGAEWIII